MVKQPDITQQVIMQQINKTNLLQKYTSKLAEVGKNCKSDNNQKVTTPEDRLNKDRCKCLRHTGT